MVFRAVFFKLLVWCRTEGYVSGLQDAAQTGHITLSSTPDQQLENHSTKYHKQQPLYNTLELLMMGIVMPETCWASSKICNKNFCCIQLAFYFHILKTMHGQNHIKSVQTLFDSTSHSHQFLLLYVIEDSANEITWNPKRSLSTILCILCGYRL